MTHLYIANCTQQNHIISFRHPDTEKVVSRSVPMGRQDDLSGREGFSPPVIDAVVAQLGIYGLRSEKDAMRDDGVIPFVYSLDVPVKRDVMEKVYNRNRGIITDAGKKRQQEAAIAASSMMDTQETPLRTMEVEIEEVSSGTIPKEDGLAKVEVGFRLDNTQSTSENRPPKRSAKQR